MSRETFLAALHETGVSQSELARRLSAAFTTVNRWARGHAALSRGRWLEVLQALGLPITWEPTSESLEAARAEIAAAEGDGKQKSKPDDE